MNPSIQLTLLHLIAIIAVVAAVTMLLRRNKMKAAQKRITELENEMLRCHHEILTLSKKDNDPGTGAISPKSHPGLSVAS